MFGRRQKRQFARSFDSLVRLDRRIPTDRNLSGRELPDHAPAVSPSTLRRYRAERLLRQEFGGLREGVLGNVRGRLRARGVHLDGGDLEACYAQAWQGLYAAVAAGEQIANPGGWLTVATFRRAIDEHRGARARAFGDPTHPERGGGGLARGAESPAAEPDLAAELDDRARLRHLFEALRSRLSTRECEAASLCYLQGLTRAQAAERMGISEARMVKLMEGRPGRPGVAGKMGDLLEAIRRGEWCEQQASLMRGFAFGILDPAGERYRLARLHQRGCPACRAYVLSLRGLAAVLPPLPLPWGLGAPPTLQAPPNHAPPTHPTLAPAGAVSASGLAGAGGAGGGWLLGGSIGAKLAVSCVLALSIGCVVFTVAPRHAGTVARGRLHREPPRRNHYTAGAAQLATGSTPLGEVLLRESSTTAPRAVSRAARAAAARIASARHALREFGPEQPPAVNGSTATATVPAPVTARAASRRPPSTGGAEPVAPTSAGLPTHAEREFGPE
jgi:DNA-directed RNA polymerase specialized sigma24 family protein